MFGLKSKRAAAVAEACSLGRHERANVVTHDGSKLTAPCVHCGERLTRTASGWRAAPTAMIMPLNADIASFNSMSSAI